jgi:flagellar L-ring protein precursor FlgH
MKPIIKTTILALGTCTILSGCSALERVADIGQTPQTTKIENPVTASNYEPVSLPMPAPKNVRREKNSLWASDRNTFFKDQRAGDIGDILTVLIDIQDEAELENSSQRSRSSAEDAQLGSLMGIETHLDRILPQVVDNNDLIDATSTSSSSGTGTIEREEAIEVKMAALITQILPNGNLVIKGRQEVVVNYEKRILSVDGVIRPEDITVGNTISYEQIAEARISYGGEGDLTDVQQPRYGQQLYDIIFPF